METTERDASAFSTGWNGGISVYILKDHTIKEITSDYGKYIVLVFTD